MDPGSGKQSGKKFIANPGGWPGRWKGGYSVSIITHKRQFFKRLTGAMSLPTPLNCFEDWQKLHNRDLAGMDRLEMARELRRVKFLLMLLVGDDQVIALTPEGELITARTWLLQRLELIRRAMWGAGR